MSKFDSNDPLADAALWLYKQGVRTVISIESSGAERTRKFTTGSFPNMRWFSCFFGGLACPLRRSPPQLLSQGLGQLAVWVGRDTLLGRYRTDGVLSRRLCDLRAQSSGCAQRLVLRPDPIQHAFGRDEGSIQLAGEAVRSPRLRRFLGLRGSAGSDRRTIRRRRTLGSWPRRRRPAVGPRTSRHRAAGSRAPHHDLPRRRCGLQAALPDRKPHGPRTDRVIPRELNETQESGGRVANRRSSTRIGQYTCRRVCDGPSRASVLTRSCTRRPKPLPASTLIK